MENSYNLNGINIYESITRDGRFCKFYHILASFEISVARYGR